MALPFVSVKDQHFAFLRFLLLENACLSFRDRSQVSIGFVVLAELVMRSILMKSGSLVDRRLAIHLDGVESYQAAAIAFRFVSTSIGDRLARPQSAAVEMIFALGEIQFEASSRTR